MGFETEDVEKSRGGMWCDAIHPSSAMHRVVAKGIRSFLTSKNPDHDWGEDEEPSGGGSMWKRLWNWKRT